MPDVIVSGNTVIRTIDKSPPPTIEVEMPPPAAPAEQLPQDGDDVRVKRINDPITLSVDGRELRDEIRRQKGDSEDPPYVWRAEQAMPPPGEHEGYHRQIKRASEAMHSARMAALGEDFTKLPTVTPEQGRELAETMVNSPPVKVTPVSDLGHPIVPLLDDQPVTELDSFKNIREAQRGVKQFRHLQDRQRAQLLQDLQAASVAEQQAEQARQEQAASPPPQPQPDPAQEVQRERVRLEAHQRQVQAHQYWNQLGAAEQAAATEMRDITDWLPSAYTQDELRNPSLIQDVERRGWLSTAVDRFNGLQQGLQNASMVRAAAQTQAAAAYQEQVTAWGKQQDDIFQRELQGRHPALYADQKRMQAAAKSYLLRTTGLTEAQITAEWSRGRWRSAPEQMILADAVSHEMARESMRNLNAKQADMPPVSSYASRPRGAGDMDRVRDLERQLASATGNASLRIATQLHQARRDAGLV
jgi:hypothetical protein